jgi:hypothetical protein
VLDSLDRLRISLTFEQELINAVNELDQETLYKGQKDRARLPRTKMVGEEQPKPLDEFIQELITKPTARELSPRALWPHFFAGLDNLGCRPMECIDDANFRKTVIRFLVERSKGRKHTKLTFAGFEKIVGDGKRRRSN